MKRAWGFGLVLLPFVAWGQGFTELLTSVHGEGRYVSGGKTVRLSQMKVQLRKGGLLVLGFSGEKQFGFTGDWSKGSPIALNVITGPNPATKGTGSLRAVAGQVVGVLDLKGQARNGPFTLHFDATGGSGGVLLDQTAIGSGHFNGKIGDNLTQAHLVLSRNGKFDLTVRGRGTWRFGGTWKYNSSGNAILAVVAPGASGSGVVYSDQHGGFKAIDLTGEAQGRLFSLAFQVDGNSGGGPSGLTASRAGTGSITAAKSTTFTLRKADVDLARSGKFRIVLYSTRSHIFEGTWGPGKNGEAVLVMTNVQGGGNIAVSGRTFTRITLTYVEGPRQYTVQFRTR